MILRLRPLAALALVGAVAGCGGSSSHGSATVATPSASDGLVQAAPDSIPDTSGIAGVKSWRTEATAQNDVPGAIEGSHVTTPVTYFTYPPVGGPHNPVWIACGIYAKTPPWEKAVHNEEHGAVIITYRPDLAADQVAALTSYVKNAPDAMLTAQGQKVDLQSAYLDLWPFSGQTSPIVLSSWGHQLDVSKADDPRIQQFVDAFRVKEGATPELGASCADPGQ